MVIKNALDLVLVVRDVKYLIKIRLIQRFIWLFNVKKKRLYISYPCKIFCPHFLQFKQSNHQMANTKHESPGTQTPLLVDDDDDVIEGAIDYQGRPVLRYSSGGWRSALFIIGKAAVNHTY